MTSHCPYLTIREIHSSNSAFRGCVCTQPMLGQGWGRQDLGARFDILTELCVKFPNTGMLQVKCLKNMVPGKSPNQENAVVPNACQLRYRRMPDTYRLK